MQYLLVLGRTGGVLGLRVLLAATILLDNLCTKWEVERSVRSLTLSLSHSLISYCKSPLPGQQGDLARGKPGDYSD